MQSMPVGFNPSLACHIRRAGDGPRFFERLMAALLVCCSFAAGAIEERIIGVLEKTEKPGACAQITDALRETYYILKTVESEKACSGRMGKKVLVKGVVEQRRGDSDYLLSLNQVELYRAEPKKSDVKPDLEKETYPLPPPPAQGEKKAEEKEAKEKPHPVDESPKEGGSAPPKDAGAKP